MQRVLAGAHLAICSFFSIAAGELRNTTFEYSTERHQRQHPWDRPVVGGVGIGSEGYDRVTRGMTILRRPKRWASREIAPGPSRTSAKATTIVFSVSKSRKGVAQTGCQK